VERVWGDPDKPGAPFVIRIHNDAGYVVLPHTHPIDENIVVVQGVWSLGIGRRFDHSALEQLDVGAFGFAPRNMAHFAWSKTETTIQVLRDRAVFKQARRSGIRAYGQGHLPAYILAPAGQPHAVQPA
jgi:hypothetical protein